MKQVLRLAFIGLLAIASLGSCKKDKGSSSINPEPPKTEETEGEKEVIGWKEGSKELIPADIRIELEVTASRKARIVLFATSHPVESNIYRDGKLLTKGQNPEASSGYTSELESFQNLRTTISTHSLILMTSLSVLSLEDDRDNATPINVTIKAKIYQNNQLIKELKKERSTKRLYDATKEHHLMQEFEILGTLK